MQQRCVQPARHHQMRGWGFTKKLEPMVWLSALLGRGRCGRQSHRCSAQVPRGEGKSCPDQRRGKRESSSAPSPECKHALLCSPRSSALLCSPLSSPACCPHRPSDLSNLLAATAGTPAPGICALAWAAVILALVSFAGLLHLHHPVNHPESCPSQQAGRHNALRRALLFEPDRAAPR